MLVTGLESKHQIHLFCLRLLYTYHKGNFIQSSQTYTGVIYARIHIMQCFKWCSIWNKFCVYWIIRKHRNSNMKFSICSFKTVFKQSLILRCFRFRAANIQQCLLFLQLISPCSKTSLGNTWQLSHFVSYTPLQCINVQRKDWPVGCWQMFPRSPRATPSRTVSQQCSQINLKTALDMRMRSALP